MYYDGLMRLLWAIVARAALDYHGLSDPDDYVSAQRFLEMANLIHKSRDIVAAHRAKQTA